MFYSIYDESILPPGSLVRSSSNSRGVSFKVNRVESASPHVNVQFIGLLAGTYELYN